MSKFIPTGAPNSSFWSGKRVLLTGHTGFKGAWLTLALKELGATVLGYGLAPEGDPNLFTALGLEQHCRNIEGNILDQALLTKTVTEFKPEIVIHMAAQALVRRSYEFPIETFATNIVGTAHLLQACRSQTSLRSILNVTTDKVYANSETGQAFTEQDALGGHDPYSASKACSELTTQSFYRSFFKDRGVTIMTARCGNVFGGGDWNQDRIVVNAVKAFVSGQALSVRSPQSVRPWLHIFDSLRGYLIAVEKGYDQPTKFSRPWNFAPLGNSITVGELADRFCTVWGKPASWNTADSGTKNPHEATLLNLNPKDAWEMLGWRQSVPLDRGIVLAVDWYKNFYANRPNQDSLYRWSKEQLFGEWRNIADAISKAA